MISSLVSIKRWCEPINIFQFCTESRRFTYIFFKGKMKYSAVLSLFVVVLCNLSSGIHAAGSKRMERRTIFETIGRVWPYTDHRRFITIQNYFRPRSASLAILTATNFRSQHWAIVFDDNLQRRKQFIILSYPVPEYILRVDKSVNPHRLALERIPFWRYVQRAPFHNPGSSYIFTIGDCYVDFRFRGQYIQHVETGLVFTHDFGFNLFLRPRQQNVYSQCWVYSNPEL